MKFEPTKIKDVVLVTPKRLKDSRGSFSETFRRDLFCKAIGRDVQFVQDNQSVSKAAYTLRGLHIQTAPSAMGKLVRCTKGRVFDVAVDVRKNSPTFGQWVGEVLDPNRGEQLWIPEGFLHGFLTLKPNSLVQYKCTSYYNAEAERTVTWNDKTLAINWPITDIPLVFSDKDRDADTFSNVIGTGV